MPDTICLLTSEGGSRGSDMVKDGLVNLCVCEGDELALQRYVCVCMLEKRKKTRPHLEKRGL